MPANTSAFAPWDGDPGQALAIAHLLRRVAGLAGVHVYECEITPQGDYRCRLWVGDAVERLLGAIPEGMSAEEAWEACVHPDDRPTYDEAYARQCKGETTEMEYRMVAFDGAVRWLWDRCIPHREDTGNIILDGIVTDVTERRRIQDELAEAAYRDPLTQLHNRRWFEIRLERALAEANPARASVAILFIDLDGFKAVNDRHGHALGDELLVCVARRIEAAAEDHAVCRLGGDEFLVLYHRDGADVTEPVRAFAERLRLRLTGSYQVGGTAVRIGASIGVAAFPAAGRTAVELQRAADRDMYQSKQRNRARAA
jgi:diguanylate cyclase (GGDEF)-like protein/PAS domain S-box-containing protein